jgi:hypothetical protein
VTATIPSNNELRAFAKQHTFRLVTLAFETADRGKVRCEGVMTIEDAATVAKWLNELVAMGNKCEKIAEANNKRKRGAK